MRLILLISLFGCVDTEPKPPGPPWEHRVDFPDGGRRLEASATGNGSRLVVYGGFTTSDREVPPLVISSDVLEFDPFNAQTPWRQLPAPPVAWTHAALVGLGGSLYLLGGLEGAAFTPNGRTFRLLPQATEWTELMPMPMGLERGAAAVVFSTGHIFLLGGSNDAGPIDTILDYTIAENTWTEFPVRLPTPRSHAAAMREDDGTFVLAGGIGVQGPLGDAYALPPGVLATWELRAPMPTARGGCAYGVLYGELVCAGGDNTAGMASRAAESYDPTLDEWTVLPDVPFERAGAAGAVVTSRLYVVGGSQTLALEPTSNVFVFDLLDTLDR